MQVSMNFINKANKIILEVSKIEVFRLEHKSSGLGPYQAKYNAKNEFADKFHIMPKYNPAPSSDNTLPKDMFSRNINSLIFAFSSIQQMKRWFTSNGIRFLLDTGEFNIISKKIPADSVFCGEYQCAIDVTEWRAAPAKIVRLTNI